MQERTRYKRKQYIVAAKFQLKYAGMILLLVFLTGILCSYVVYYTSMIVLGDKLASVYPQGHLVSIVSAVNSRILLSLILISPIIFMIGIFASHKIAGPIFRIEKTLDGMAKGDYSAPITLRKNDELVALANGINKVMESMRETVKKEKKEIGGLSASLDDLKKVCGSKPVNHDALDKAIDKLSGEVSALRKEIERYKV